MATPLDLLTCRQPGCDGPRSGFCINNLPFDDCPDVIEASTSDADESEGDESPDLEVDSTPLPGGHALDAAGCDALLRRRGGLVVGLVAGPEAGKTTLIATIYEMLQRRRLPCFGFAGSETLRGFEERCHLARTASGATLADTKRTPTKARLSFLHLDVAIQKKRVDLVFSDRSGEHFDEALQRPSDIGAFEELQRADVILVLVDLDELVRDTQVRTSAVRRLLIAMRQHLPLEQKRLLILGTKADLAKTAPQKRRLDRAFDTIVSDLRGRLGSGIDLDSMTIACRPRVGETGIGEGVEELLSAITATRSVDGVEKDEFWPESMSGPDLLMLPFRARTS